MCEICKWAQERNLACLGEKEPVQIQLPMAIATHAYGLQSPIFKMKYCPKCGRRLKK